jgi:hypothetical protein
MPPILLCMILSSITLGEYPPSATDSAVWDRVIAAQPFDRAPFRQNRIPAWVQETVGCGYTLSVTGSAGRARARDLGVSISELGFVDPFYAYYDSKLLRRRSPQVLLERISKDVDEYRRLGLRILGVYPPCLQAEVYELHPDCRRVDRPTNDITQVDLKQYPYSHLYSDLNTTAFHAHPADEVPLREEVIPIPELRFAFHHRDRIGSPRLEREGIDLTLHKDPTSTSATVPRLEVHSIVVAEIEPYPTHESACGAVDR